MTRVGQLKIEALGYRWGGVAVQTLENGFPLLNTLKTNLMISNLIIDFWESGQS